MPAPFPGLQRWPHTETGLTLTAGVRRGRWLMSGDTRRSTAFLDLETWPPTPVLNRGEYVTSFDVLPDGRLVVCSMRTDPPGEYAVRVHPAGWPTDPAAGPAVVRPGLPAGTMMTVWAVGGTVVAFRPLIEKGDRPDARQAYVLTGDRFVPSPDLPAVAAFGPGPLSQQVHANGKATLASGADVLLWDGHGYDPRPGGRFVRGWELAAVDSAMREGWTAVPWGDGFFYLSDRRVVYARPGCAPVPVCPDAENVMHLAAGPDDSVILNHGKTRTPFVARVWFPREGTYIPVSRGHLGVRPHFSPGEWHWSAVTRHVYFKYGVIHTFPDADLLALKRVKPQDGYRVPTP